MTNEKIFCSQIFIKITQEVHLIVSIESQKRQKSRSALKKNLTVNKIDMKTFLEISYRVESCTYHHSLKSNNCNQKLQQK